MSENPEAKLSNRMGIRWETAMEKVLQQLDDLYLVGARNFVLVDVPPVQRTPAGMENLPVISETRAH